MSETKNLVEKWGDILNDESGAYPVIKDDYRKYVTAQLIENTVNANHGNQTGIKGLLNEAAPINNTSQVQNYDPVLINLVRRAAPQLIAYDVCGVSPMTGPSGLIFAIRSQYANTTAMVGEAFYNEANTGWSTVRGGNTQIVGDASGNLGGNTTVPVSGNSQVFNYAGGMTTAQGEALGTSGNVGFAEMGFTIDKISVTARERALKAEYTLETAQDLKALHGLDAETELSNILQTELLAEINREVVRLLYLTAKTGMATGTTTAGEFDLDTDSNGRWMGEKFAGLHFAIEREANAIAKETRRGKGNILICSSDVASALKMANVLNVKAAENLQIDDTGSTFAGVLGGSIKVYIDPYALGDYMVLGYKGTAAWDAGFFYCPYVPLQMVRAVNPSSFTPAIGFKTRYGMVANPFSRGATTSDGSLVQNANVYYRRGIVKNIQ